LAKITLRPRKSSIAYLLAIPPLGLFGMHKFYLHRPFLGALYFFTGGLLLVGWLYDLVTMSEQVQAFNMKRKLLPSLEEVLESEIDELEEALEEMQLEMAELKADSLNVNQLKQKISALEAQLRTHNERR
tara:strand:+ start:34 stop:423 length:390 start_codon:yes stop_codon:yes gene_type:complete